MQSQSNPPEMCACTHLIGHRGVLLDDVVLQQQFSEGQLFSLDAPAFFLWVPSVFTPPLCHRTGHLIDRWDLGQKHKLFFVGFFMLILVLVVT